MGTMRRDVLQRSVTHMTLDLELDKARIAGLRAERNALQRVIQKFDDELADWDDIQREKVLERFKNKDAQIRSQDVQTSRMEKTVADYKMQLEELHN